MDRTLRFRVPETVLRVPDSLEGGTDLREAVVVLTVWKDPGKHQQGYTAVPERTGQSAALQDRDSVLGTIPQAHSVGFVHRS